MCRGHGRVQLYLYPPSGPHRSCNEVTLPFFIVCYASSWFSKNGLSPLWTGSTLSLHQIKEQTYVYNKSRSYLTYSAGTNRPLITLFASGNGGQCRARFPTDIIVLVTFEMRLYGNKLLISGYLDSCVSEMASRGYLSQCSK
jgi:hypothetical protein